MIGRVEAIHITHAAGAPMEALEEVEALVGSGLAGDRYLLGTGFYSARPRPDGGRELTLIEAEVLATLAAEYDIPLTAADSRRNLTTRGLRLPNLIGRRFAIGAIVCEGVDHCPPCQHLVDVTGRAVLAPLVGRGGIRARIVVGGWLHVGDTITVFEESPRTSGSPIAQRA
jgi:MOSC domain-containing protein YiiM